MTDDVEPPRLLKHAVLNMSVYITDVEKLQQFVAGAFAGEDEPWLNHELEVALNMIFAQALSATEDATGVAPGSGGTIVRLVDEHGWAEEVHLPRIPPVGWNPEDHQE